MFRLNLIGLIQFDLVILQISLIKQMRLNSDKPVGRIFPLSRLIFLDLYIYTVTRRLQRIEQAFHNLTEAALKNTFLRSYRKRCLLNLLLRKLLLSQHLRQKLLS